jgi:hypothetical protein
LNTRTEQMLEDLGIPVACCPTCETCNWGFHGAVDVGITAVFCQTCERHYRMMDVIQECAHLADRLALEVRQHGSKANNKLYWRLTEAWNKLGSHSLTHRRAVCTYDGRAGADEAHDDVPF